jgi:putative hydrolase of the HAD superfamily
MQTIIFDFGNVVGFFDHELTLSRLAPHTDMPPHEMFHTVYGGAMEDSFEEGKISMAKFLSESRRLCRLRCDEDYMATAFADIFRPNDEVCELIPKLKKRYRILLGSNTNELHSSKFIVQFKDVLSHFDDLVLSCKIQVRKPAAGFFQHCVELAKCPAEECLFIDDLPVNIAGAQASGLKGLVYEPRGDLADRLRAVGIQW